MRLQEVGYHLMGLTISEKKGDKSLSSQELNASNAYVIKEYKRGKHELSISEIKNYKHKMSCKL